MKIKSELTKLMAVTAFLFSACSTPPPPPEAPKAINMDSLKVEIQAMEDAFAAGEKAKDANAVVAYYSDDAISYARNKEPLSGKEAIKNSIAENLAKDTTGSTSVYKVVDLFAQGDMAVEIGSWQDMDKDGQETKHGYYMSVFQQRDGKYVCIRDMNVSCMPLKPEDAKPAAGM